MSSSALGLIDVVPAAAARPSVVYAYAAGSVAVPGCPTEQTASKGCSLAQALAQASPGSSVDLATSARVSHYVGNWTVTTPGTSSRAPILIGPAPGTGSPTLDGDAGNGSGGAVQNDHGGTVSVVDVNFSNDRATNGGAIDNGDSSGEGTMAVSGSTFSDNVSDANDDTEYGYGGAIDNGDGGGHGNLTVVNSTFSGNSGGAPQTSGISGNDGAGGAINNGYGRLSVVNSDLSGNAGGAGGAIENDDGTVSVTTSTLSGNESDGSGGATTAATCRYHGRQ